MSKSLEVDICTSYNGPLRKKREVFLIKIDARHIKESIKGIWAPPRMPRFE